MLAESLRREHRQSVLILSTATHFGLDCSSFMVSKMAVASGSSCHSKPLGHSPQSFAFKPPGQTGMSVLLQILELIRLVSVELFQLIESEVFELFGFRRVIFCGPCVPFGRRQVLEVKRLGGDAAFHRRLIE